MHNVELIIGGLLAIALLVPLADRIGVPAPVVLVLAGLGLGTLPFAPDVRLDPELIFLLFLPPILYPAAFRYAAEDVRGHSRAIGLLAFGLTAASIAAIAAVARLAGLSWGAAVVLGAVLSPTDPVAATAILRRVGAPQRLVVILEGESLVNDGVALSAFKIAVAAAGAGTVAFGEGLLKFVLYAVGGVLVGAVIGWVATQVRKRLDLGDVEITLSLLAAFASFAAAERLHASGIIAVVVTGYLVGRQASHIATPQTRLKSRSFWETASFLAESGLFLLIGLRFPRVIENLGSTWVEAVGIALLAALTIFAVRCAWLFLTTPLIARLDAEVGGITWRERVVLTVGGMRGAVSAAAALAVPVSAEAGGAFPERETLIAVTFLTVAVTLVLPALALPAILRRLDLQAAGVTEREVAGARVELGRAALERADELEGEVPGDALRHARERYEVRVADADEARAYRETRRRLIEAEREKLHALRDEGKVAGEVARELEGSLDMEETRLRRST